MALKFGADYISLEGMLSYLDMTDKSPYRIIGDDKWLGLRTLILQNLFTSRDPQINGEALQRYITALRDELIDLTRILSSLVGDDYWSPVARSNLDALISSTEGAENSYRDLMDKFHKARAEMSGRAA